MHATTDFMELVYLYYLAVPNQRDGMLAEPTYITKHRYLVNTHRITSLKKDNPSHTQLL